MSRAAKLLLVPVLLAQAVFFFFIASHRFVDGDEGFYLLASRLVLLHKKPYVDFSYVQAPLLPYAYALWMKLTGISWMWARAFAAVLTTLLGMLLYVEVCRETHKWLAGVAAVVLFASSTLVFACFPAAHPFSLATLFLFVAYMMVIRGTAHAAPRWEAGAGILLGLSVDTRAYLLLVVLVFAWFIFRNAEEGGRARSMFWFFAGFAAGLLPCLYFFLQSPGAFLFNNLGYHALRSSAGLIGAWPEKLVVLLMFFLGGPQGNGVQNSILFFVSLGCFLVVGERKTASRLAFYTAISIAIVSLLPTPAYPGYFSLCIPFLVVSTVCLVNDLLLTAKSQRARLVAVAACVAGLAVYIASSTPDLRKYLVTGEGIASVGKARDKNDWRMEQVVAVSQAIDQLAAPGEVVASFWPGYLFQTRAMPLSGLQNDFVLPIADKLTVQQRERYHVVSAVELESDFASHTPRIVVLGNQNIFVVQLMGHKSEDSLRAAGYSVARSIGDASIHVCCSKP